MKTMEVLIFILFNILIKNNLKSQLIVYLVTYTVSVNMKKYNRTVLIV